MDLVVHYDPEYVRFRRLGHYDVKIAGAQEIRFLGYNVIIEGSTMVHSFHTAVIDRITATP